MAKRSRTERREREREAKKLAEARVKLAALEPGGAPDRPVEVTSASGVGTAFTLWLPVATPSARHDMPSAAEIAEAHRA